MLLDMIRENVTRLLQEIPESVTVVAAAKAHPAAVVQEVLASGITVIGENYVKEAKAKIEVIGAAAQWHFIGHVQKNKVKKAAALFDMIQTLDSVKLAQSLEKECARINKIMPVLIEVNSAEEEQKSGVMPEETISFVKLVAAFPHLNVQGLMTMGPFEDDAERMRPYFKITKALFDEILASGQYPQWQYLSMGMTESYPVAIQEGATMVRIGSAIFGPRVY